MKAKIFLFFLAITACKSTQPSSDLSSGGLSKQDEANARKVVSVEQVEFSRLCITENGQFEELTPQRYLELSGQSDSTLISEKDVISFQICDLKEIDKAKLDQYVTKSFRFSCTTFPENDAQFWGTLVMWPVTSESVFEVKTETVEAFRTAAADPSFKGDVRFTCLRLPKPDNMVEAL